MKKACKVINYNQIVKYFLIGILTTIVSLTVYYGLVFTVLSPQNPIHLQLANIVSWIMGVTFAYISNRIVVFKSCSNDIKKEIIEFYLARMGTLLLEMAGMFIMVTLLKMNDKLIKLAVSFATATINYFLGKLWIFKNTEG